MVMSMAVILVRLGGWRFSIPDRSGHLFRHAGRHPRRRASCLASVGAGRHTDQLGEATAEGAQRRAADRETEVPGRHVHTAGERASAVMTAPPSELIRYPGIGTGAPPPLRPPRRTAPTPRRESTRPARSAAARAAPARAAARPIRDNP